MRIHELYFEFVLQLKINSSICQALTYAPHYSYLDTADLDTDPQVL